MGRGQSRSGSLSLDDFPRGVLARGDYGQETPSAAWRPVADILRDADLPYSPEKVLLGRAGDAVIGLADDRHAVTVAGSRAGKGVSVIIPNLLLYAGSVFAIDPKGELASITARRRAKLGQKVRVLDPFGVCAPWIEPFRASFNPLSILDPGSRTLLEDAALIGDALVIPSGSGDSVHWDESARHFIEGVILHVATSPEYEGRRSLVTVYELLMHGPEMEGTRGIAALCAEMQLNKAADGKPGEGAVEAAAVAFIEKPENERGSVLSTVRRHVRFLGYEALQGVLAGHDFDLSDLKTSGLSVYLCLPAGRLGTCAGWLRLFVNLALEAMEREKTKPAVPVLMMLDEFAALGHMRQIEAAAGQIAGFGVKLWPVLQDLTQLKALYKERWETFLGNAGFLQFFGNNDVTTLDFASKRLGRTSLIVSRQSQTARDQQLQGSTGESWATEVHDLMTPDEIGRFFARNDPARRQLVILAGRERPMALQRVVFHEDREFRGLYDEWQ